MSCFTYSWFIFRKCLGQLVKIHSLCQEAASPVKTQVVMPATQILTSLRKPHSTSKNWRLEVGWKNFIPSEIGFNPPIAYFHTSPSVNIYEIVTSDIFFGAVVVFLAEASRSHLSSFDNDR